MNDIVIQAHTLLLRLVPAASETILETAVLAFTPHRREELKVRAATEKPRQASPPILGIQRANSIFKTERERVHRFGHSRASPRSRSGSFEVTCVCFPPPACTEMQRKLPRKKHPKYGRVPRTTYADAWLEVGEPAFTKCYIQRVPLNRKCAPQHRHSYEVVFDLVGVQESREPVVDRNACPNKEYPNAWRGHGSWLRVKSSGFGEQRTGRNQEIALGILSARYPILWAQVNECNQP